ncbi:MAG TPA: MOSC domain-containing protein [Aquihabitans sp.]|nr:MOSC domain-containing protein [Aquihabitans sp.]
MGDGIRGVVEGVSRSDGHRFSKDAEEAVELLAGLGVAGDAHAGATVQHRSRVRVDPTQPNLRQVHLIGAELHDELAGRGFTVAPGDLGENLTTRGIDLLALPTGTVLRIGDTALVAVTGLRNPCGQLDGFAEGLKAAVLDRAPDGSLVRRGGVMGVVIQGGTVRPGDAVVAGMPPGRPEPLRPV